MYKTDCALCPNFLAHPGLLSKHVTSRIPRALSCCGLRSFPHCVYSRESATLSNFPILHALTDLINLAHTSRISRETDGDGSRTVHRMKRGVSRVYHGGGTVRRRRLVKVSIVAGVLLLCVFIRRSLPVPLPPPVSQKNDTATAGQVVVLQESKKVTSYPPSNATYCSGHDEACCLRIGPAEWTTHRIVNAKMVNGMGARVAVYASHDIVSYEIASQHEWDREKTKLIHEALRTLGGDASFVDIGANVGWFTLAMAYAGYRVYAIEPFAANVGVLQHSLCIAPPEVRARVTVLPYGLADADGGSCELWQDPHVNKGDTFVVCSPNSDSARNLKRTRHRKLGTVNLITLDSLVADGRVGLRKGDKTVVKMDTEGFEPYVIRGARRFLADVHPNVVYSEYGEAMIRRVANSMGWSDEKAKALSNEFIDSMRNAGYRLTTPIVAGIINDITFSA